MPRSYPYAGEYTAVSECSAIRRVSKREELADDLRSTCESEVQVWEQAFLVQRILCRYSGTNKERIAEYIRNQLQEDAMAVQISMKEFIDPFTGAKKK